MTVPFEPRGAWTALISPFARDRSLDEARFRRLVEFQVKQGSTGVVPCGTTGESPTLTWKEHDDIVEMALDQAADRVGVLTGAGSNNTAEAIRGTKDAHETGASAVLLVDCYYNGPSSLELRTEYYQRVLDAVPDIPIVPYVIPGRSGCALTSEDLAILHQTDPKRVPAVKQATGDLHWMRRDRELCGDSLAILSGDDDMTLYMMGDPTVAASGVISVMANVVPAAIQEMVTSHAEGDVGKAGEIGGKLGPLLKLVSCKVRNVRRLPDGRELEVEDKFRNPVPVKTMMRGLGMLEGPCRPPLGKMTPRAVELCRDALRSVQESAPEYLRPIEDAFEVSIQKRLDDDEVWNELCA